MHTVTSFHASAVRPDRVSAVTSQYLSVERARVMRRLLVARLGSLALIPTVLGFVLHRLSAVATWFSIGVFLFPAVSAWIVELRRARQLTRALGDLPSSTTYVVARPDAGEQKVVKNS